MKNTLLFLISFCVACSKTYDIPPLKPVASGPAINIAQIKAKFKTGQTYTFQNDSNLYCVITADETCGNLYQELYVKDVTGGLHIGLTSGGGLFTGDSIRINLKGATLQEDNRLITVDGIPPETNIVKFASGWNVQPVKRPLSDLIANTNATNTAQSLLVEISDVAFVAADRNQFFANEATRTALTRTLNTCGGIQLIVRTSGYSLLAGKRTPSGMGSITGILSQYGTTFQLLVRSVSDINMNLPLCAEPKIYLLKDFNDNSLTSGGWSTQTISANVNWSISSNGAASPFARISNYSSSTNPKNTPCETWLLSPAIDLSSAVTPVLTIRHAHDFAGSGLEIYSSTRYISGKPTLNEWRRMDSLTGPLGFTFITAGPYYLSNEKGQNFRIAFRYRGTANNGATWQVDDIRLFEK